MGVFQGFKNIFLGEEEIEQEDNYRTVYENDNKITAEQTVYSPIHEQVNNSNNFSTSNSNNKKQSEEDGSLKIVLARPDNFSEVTSIGDDINTKKTVLLNLETVKSEDAKRILDFISGVAYANSAQIKMMAQKTFAIIPSNIKFIGEDLMSELENNGYSF